MNEHVERHKKAKERISLILAKPSSFDPVYRGLRPIFSHKGPLNLKRPDDQRFEVREAADRRFKLGYPPRKSNDTSLGDSSNWEWLIKCAQSTQNSNVLIVSRDGDYGITQGDNVILNDWLKAEFAARVGPKRKIEITNRLTVALKKLAEVVSPEDEAAEKSVLTGNDENWLGGIRELTPEEYRIYAETLRNFAPRTLKIPLT